MSEPELVKNDDENRYELRAEGERIGFIDWVRDGHIVELTHTEVDPAHGGKGYAAMLADFALADIRDAGLNVKATCSFVARHIENNPEFGSIHVA
ncbi:GNAT family N-acetyltransferase [Tessaracoccus antarcticus]|nr:GNAT family N-acetyltransferase [Tessaracoccus antarcticus]